MLYIKRKINFKRVEYPFVLKAKEYIHEQCINHYGPHISKQRYKYLEERILLDIKDSKNGFFIAVNEDNKIVGSISVSCYDNRIESLKDRYKNSKVAEVGRCYVLEKYRKEGIGSKLFELAYNFANKKNYEMLYLHTHYFLPGGFTFWQKMGFEITLDESNILQTVHMEKNFVI